MNTPHPDLDTLYRYIDKRLPPEKRLAVRDHLLDCRSCKHEVELEERLHNSLRGSLLVQAPPGMTESVMSRIAPAGKEDSVVKTIFKSLFFSGNILLISLTGVAILLTLIAVFGPASSSPSSLAIPGFGEVSHLLERAGEISALDPETLADSFEGIFSFLNTRLIVIIFLVILALAAVDRLLIQNLLRIRG